MDLPIGMDLTDPTVEPSLQPELGVISQTLSSSPNVKWILPARIRSPSKNDVVFVGDTSIQLREFVTTGSTHLADATDNLDFQTQILAAKVISARLEPIPVLEATINQSGDDERFTIDGQPVKEGEPPQILVLSTASCQLIFVFAQDRYDGSVRFVYAKRPLLGGMKLAERIGRHLAVDPESRAVAVAPAMGHFALLSMRPIDEIRRQIDNWQPADPASFRPFYEQRLAQLDGVIVKMDFLHSPEDEKEKVMLALLVANKGSIFLLLYRWDTRMPLHRFKPMRCSGQRLPPDDGFPLMLIPCVSSLSFLLVTETGLIIYDQVIASEAHTTRYSFKASDIVGTDSPARSKQWTQWARPKRHLQYRRMHDDIFLIREDGVIETCLIDFTNRKVKVTTSVTPGRLDICVDTAFCLLAGPAHTGGGDIIIAGGDMTDGGLFQARARQPMERIQPLSNGAPFQDMVLVTPKAKNISRDNHSVGTSEIFACCGHTESKGSVAHIRHGLDAQIGWTVDHPDAASIERLWTLEDNSHDTLLILSSHPSHTSMLVLGLEEMDLEYAENESYPGLDFNQPTFEAATLGQRAAIQVTLGAVNIQSLADTSTSSRLDIRHLEPLCAAFHAKGEFVVIGHRSKSVYALSLCRINNDEADRARASRPHECAQLQTRPICVCAASLGGATLVLTGTEDGEIYVHGVDHEPETRLVLRINLQDLVPGLDGIAVSSLCLLARHTSTSGLMLCGLRGGSLVCIEVKGEQHDGQPRLLPKIAGSYRLGSTTTTVFPDSSIPGDTMVSAFALCRSTLKKISLRDTVSDVDFEVLDVCITTRNDTSQPQPICNVVRRIQRLQSYCGLETSGLMIGVTADDIFFASLSSQRRAVMRHFSVPGVPKRIIYSKYLDQLVIGIDSSTGGSSSAQADGSTTPHLYFTSTNPNSVESTDTVKPQRVAVGDIGESIKTMVGFVPTDGRKHYEMIVIGLIKEIREPNGVAKPMSRVVCLSAKQIMKGNSAAANARAVMTFPGKKVTALCPLGKSSILIAAGNEIILHSLDIDTKKWLTQSRHALPSLAASIHVQGSFIFVACIRHSLLILHEDSNKLKFYASDAGAKVTNNVLSFDRYKAIITSVSDRGTDVIGFAEDRLSNGYRRLFEANVPLMVDRLRAEHEGQSQSNARSSFIGSTTDGTFYRFIIIKPEEWRLLHLIQGLWLQEKEVPLGPWLTSGPIPRQSTDNTASRMPFPTPEQMHINGDILASMVEPGYTSLRDLLQAQVKVENETGVKGDVAANLRKLKELAEPLLGPNEDMIGAVSRWLRKLLQWPAV